MEPRSLPEDFSYKIRDNKKFTLILISSHGKISFENSRNGKDELVKLFNLDINSVILMAWTGQYSTDIFQINRANLDKHYC